MRFELFYSDGGHGGPYLSEVEAEAAALRLIHGCKTTRRIEIRPYSAEGIGGYGATIITVKKTLVETITIERK